MERTRADAVREQPAAGRRARRQDLRHGLRLAGHTPDATTGGRVAVLPTAVGTAVEVVGGGSGAPFIVSLVVPVPNPGETPIGVRLQPQVALPSGATAPSGVSVAKVVVIDVYDTRSGALIHDHSSDPLELTIRLTEDERTVCRSDPGRIALLHVDQARVVTRAPIGELDCSSGSLRARLTATSAYALAKLSHPLTIALRTLLPSGQRGHAGG